MCDFETTGQNESSVYWEMHKVQSAAPIKSNQLLNSGLAFAGTFTGNSSYRTLHKAWMAYWLVNVNMQHTVMQWVIKCSKHCNIFCQYNS